VCRQNAIPVAVQQLNASWQKKLAGTVWANYELLDTMNPPPPGQQGFPIPVTNVPVNLQTLANTSMETYVQKTSCLTCHANAFPENAPHTSEFQVFSFLLGNADSSSPSVKPAGIPGSVLNMVRRSHSKRTQR
jgi:hypothetical protein